MTRPLKLPLKPGLRWTGSLTVLGRDGDKWIVSWDAQCGNEYIYDRCTLSTQQIVDWTGVDPSVGKVG